MPAAEERPMAPLDEHNRTLVGNVHPADWRNPEPAGRYNLVVVGAGTAGLVSAIGSAGLGARVALVERHLMGGDCLNVGCVPSKALLRASRAAADARRAGEFGVRAGAVAVDFPAVMERMRRLRAGISANDSARRYADRGVDVFLGDGRFTGPDALEVGGKTLRFSKAVIATGARAAAPPVPGLAEAGYLTNETVFSLTELPRRLVVIGAGPIGCELSQAFARFGSEVSVLDMADRVLSREDGDAANVVQDALARDGVGLVLGCKVLRASRRGAEKVVEVEQAGRRREIACDEILVGAGRAPNVEGLGLEIAGVEYDKRGVKVDDCLRTTNRRIYAAGDVALPHKFTHVADAAARIVIQNALFGLPFLRKRASALTIPWCTYTDPEVAHVGLHEREARERGLDAAVVKIELADVDRAVLDGDTEGFLKVLHGRRSGRILGATLVARHAGEMISELTLAITAGVPLGKIASVIHPYPTQAEVFRRAADAYNRTRLTPAIQSLFSSWLARSRS